ncbi:RHS repeat-associated core domain-containing protein [Sorangium sp. So ce281]|uniref:RHS repeat-associated core domain-containing protein n=1 Tax=unclassified Sorangium TaxID=2621164 RepID=UPI003F6484CB
MGGTPILRYDRAAGSYRFGLGGQLLYQNSNDSGERWMLADATGQRLRAWNGRGFSYRWSYDVLRRITLEHVQPLSASERLARRYVYGEAHPQATALNLRRQAHQVYDGAGVVTSQAYDFKGNLLQASRRLRSDVHGDADWSVLSALTDVAAIAAAAEPLLEAESFGTQTAYDALNRPTSLTAPDGLTASDASEIKPTYNEASLLERIQVRVRGAAAWTTFVDNIDYDAKGQRERIDYGNGTSTVYTYDPLTFRLTRLRTTRSSDGAVLQNLTYTYDPVGNIVEINDSAQQTVFFNNAVVSPNAQYIYDAVYRLIEATGREHAGGLADVQRDQNDLPIQALPHANDAQALRNYTEKYFYDAVGNIQRMEHLAGVGTWIRRYSYEMTSNRLKSTFGDPEDEPSSPMYVHDAHGNMTAMPHIAALTWDENDQLRSTDLDGGGVVYYAYDAAGQRVRKVWEHNGLVEERIYLGGYEVYRKRNATGLVLERQTLHVMDGARRVAMVETKTVDTSGPFTVTPRVRYQLDNHLGSASLEVDGAGLVIGYEEYHPFGTTAYWSASSAAEVSRKRYRYTGKEKDEETGLYYHGARYYAPWLGRWTAADPAGMVDGPNVYAYCTNSPVANRDSNGMQTTACPSGNCHAPNPNSDWHLTADDSPPFAAEDVRAFLEADKAARQAEADSETQLQTEIAARDVEAHNGNICKHGCHGLTAIKGVGMTTEHANASAEKAAALIFAPVAIVGGTEAVATYGLLQGLILPTIGGHLGSTVAHGTAKSLGASDDVADAAGFAGGLLGGLAASSFKFSLADAEAGGSKWLSRDAFGSAVTKSEYAAPGAIHGQETESFCTAANCQNILSDAGYDFSQKTIANAIGTTTEGTILADVPAGLKGLGIPNARFEPKLTIEQLNEVLGPGRSAVVGTRIPGTGSHTLTVDSIDHGAGLVFIRDPLPGFTGSSYGISTSDFKEVWKGTAVFLF